MQGNCSDPEVGTPLGLSTDEWATLLPLKPRQCVLIVPGSFLTVKAGQVWLDNLYLMMHHTAPESVSAFVRTDTPLRTDTDGVPRGAASAAILGPDLFVTATTFHRQYRGTVCGVQMTMARSRLFLQGGNPASLSCLATCIGPELHVQWEEKTRIEHHARASRASATAPLRIAATMCKTGACMCSRSGATTEPDCRRSIQE